MSCLTYQAMNDSELAVTIGKSVRAARSALGLSQADVAEKVSRSPEFLGRIERGVTLPSVPTLVSLALALKVPSDTLLGLSSGRLATTYREDSQSETSRTRRLLERRLSRSPESTLRLVSLLLAEFENAAKTSRRNVHRTKRKSKKVRSG